MPRNKQLSIHPFVVTIVFELYRRGWLNSAAISRRLCSLIFRTYYRSGESIFGDKKMDGRIPVWNASTVTI